MVISFKIQKKGRRYKPKPRSSTEGFNGENSEGAASSLQAPTLKGRTQSSDEDIQMSCSSTSFVPEDHEASFNLNLYPNGYSIEIPRENRSTNKQDPREIPRPSLLRYNNASQSLFSEIESGLLPLEIPEEILCKYTDGAIVCEIRDYRDRAAEQECSSQINSCPVIKRVRLRMSSANVVKDLPLIADDSWTYSDFLEVESRIVKALKPELLLDPAPDLDRLCRNTQTLKKLNLIRRNRPSKVPGMFEGTAEELKNGGLGNTLGLRPNTLSNKTMHQIGVGSSLRSISGHLGKRGTQDWQMATTTSASRSNKISRTLSHQQQQLQRQQQQPPLDVNHEKFPSCRRATSSSQFDGAQMTQGVVKERITADDIARGDLADNSYSQTLQMSRGLLSEVSDPPQPTREYLLHQESLFQINPDLFLPKTQALHQQRQQQHEWHQLNGNPFHQSQQSLISNRAPNQTKLINALQDLRTTTGQSSQPSPVIMEVVQRQSKLQQQEQNQMMMLRRGSSMGGRSTGSSIDAAGNRNTTSWRGVSEIVPPIPGVSSNIGQLNLNLSSGFGNGLLGLKQAHLDCSTSRYKPGINYLELAAQKVATETAWNQQQQQKQQNTGSNSKGNFSMK